MTSVSHYNNGDIPEDLFNEITNRYDRGDYTRVQGSTVITADTNGCEFVGEATGDFDEVDDVEIQWTPNDGEEFEVGSIHRRN